MPWEPLKNIPSFFLNLIFTIIFAVYFQLDHEGLRKYWGRAFRALFPTRFNDGIRLFAVDANRVFSGYIRGQFPDAILMAISISIALVARRGPVLRPHRHLHRHRQPDSLRGADRRLLLHDLICLINGDYLRLVIGVVIVFVIQTIDGNIVNPKLLSSNMRCTRCWSSSP